MLPAARVVNTSELRVEAQSTKSKRRRHPQTAVGRDREYCLQPELNLSRRADKAACADRGVWEIELRVVQEVAALTKLTAEWFHVGRR